MLYTSLHAIREHHPCSDGWTKLLRGLDKTTADNEPLSFADILRINGLVDALWCARAAPEHSKHWRLFAVWCARQVQHLMRDPRSLAALDVAERYAHGDRTEADLRDAHTAAAAAYASSDAPAAAAAAAYSATAAAAAYSAVDATAAAAYAAYATAPPGYAADAAAADARATQATEFLRLVTEAQ